MIDLLRSRRSIRRFTKKPIDAESIELIEEALLRSFSSRNIQPWQFIFVDDGELLKKLAVAKEHGAEFLSGAALAVVIAGDEETSDVWIEDCSIAAAIAHL
ncbi:MAG: nitroreductase family protein, partial [Deltaproteobacteria bacterium]|nr:nitroreductase family protein [Deltaproteobacteria bacterium]